VGPHVRFNDYDPASGSWGVSVLVVSSPGLAGSTVQLHYAVNAPASQSAPSMVLDEFMGGCCWPQKRRCVLVMIGESAWCWRSSCRWLGALLHSHMASA
jgi:hypothetical protein